MDEAGDQPTLKSAPMVCALCGVTWVAIFPPEAKKLECPKCHHMNPLTELT